MENEQDDGRGSTHDVTPQPRVDDVSSASHPLSRSKTPGYAGKARAVRERVKSRSVVNLFYRVVVGVVGFAVLVVGLVLVPFPGPGWLVVIIGLAILATEFSWAQRALEIVRATVTAWTRWLGRQGWPVRILIGLGTALVVAGTLYLLARVLGIGIPGIDS